MSAELTVRRRDERGRRAVRRLRRTGEIPAILYGHGQENIPLAVSAKAIDQLVHHGTKLVDLRGAVHEQALIREVQWNPLGNEILHVDFFRVSAGERVRTTVPIHLRGEAPGARHGGVIEHVLHELELECPVGSLPERLDVNIAALDVGQAIHVRELELPPGARALAAPDLVVVHCVLPRGVAAAEEELVAPAAATEPELVRRKPEKEEPAE
ncbi:MAG: 50S ribosomal protein L25 [Pirellulaceae bacterium]|nr:MAG: 50S ribosomal protein L25 [Pirellulaceae bacterium]